MSKVMLMKTEKLIGYPLDYAVAKCLGKEKTWGNSSLSPHEFFCGIRYSSSWEYAGPLIEQARIEIRYYTNMIVAGIWYRDGIGSDEMLYRSAGETALIACMRCFVKSKLGNYVDIPQTIIELEGVDEKESF